MERLQKVLAKAGIASRRKCEQLILDGLVEVNGRVVSELGVKVDPNKDQIRLSGKEVKAESLKYLLLFKPRGVVSTAFDPEGRKTVLDLVADVQERVFPVGRLDLDTSGLLLLTNDGTLTHGLLHPSHEIHKTYLARVSGQVSNQTVRQLETGVLLEDGMTAPARVQIQRTYAESTTLEITIHEGRNRQVRRMCEEVGHPVESLMRVKLAFLTIGSLKPKEYRELTPLEIERLYDITGIK